jgi:hypothetical protein
MEIAATIENFPTLCSKREQYINQHSAAITAMTGFFPHYCSI